MNNYTNIKLQYVLYLNNYDSFLILKYIDKFQFFNEDCLTCHGDKNEFRYALKLLQEQNTSLFVDAKTYICTKLFNNEVYKIVLLYCMNTQLASLDDYQQLVKIKLNDIEKTDLPPHIKDILNECILIVNHEKIEKKIIDFNKDGKIRSIDYLNKNLINQTDLVGWPHFLNTSSIGVIGTAMGILCCHAAKIYSSCLQEAVMSLKKMQNTDGGWSIKSLMGESSVSITESTLFCMWALLESGCESDDRHISQAKYWIENAQNDQGFWGATSASSEGRVYPTALAIRILFRVDPQCKAIKRGIKWLESARNSDGGWGIYFSKSRNDEESSAIHTAHVIISLLSIGYDKKDEIIQKAVKYILDNFSKQKNGGWPPNSEFEFVDKNSAIDFKHFSTPWCLIALIKAGIDLSSPEIVFTVNCLMKMQHKEGYWTHTSVPGQKPIWAIHDSLHAFAELTKYFYSNENIDFYNRIIQKNVKEIIELIIRSKSGLKQKRFLGYKSIAWLGLWNIAITLFFIITFIVIFISGNKFTNNTFFNNILSFLATIIAGFATGFSPFIYNYVRDEYKKRRNH